MKGHIDPMDLTRPSRKQMNKAMIHDNYINGKPQTSPKSAKIKNKASNKRRKGN